MTDKKELWEIIDSHAKEFERISDAIWETPELCFMEYKSSALQMEYMKKNDFRITSPVADMDTAFIAEYGEGHPIIGILGEFDALANQSQEADHLGAKPISPGANGHACGHNLLGTGSMEAVCALKEYMTAHQIKGTLRYYGCPAEEGGGGKVFLSRAGVFDDVDCAFSWHPGDDNRLDNAGLACVTFDLQFEGVAAHAAGEPWNGRSALDAVTLLNVGVQFLREHATPDARIHYAVIDTGGQAPNVVQHSASVRYCVRANHSDYMEELYHRVLKTAQGAALMTETTLKEPVIISAYNNFLSNEVLDVLMLDIMKELFPISYTPEELAYAASFQKYGNKPDRETPIDTGIDTNLHMTAIGSTDVADVSYCTPITQARIASCAIGSIGHGWTTTAQGKSAIAHKGMHTAAKAMAGCVVELWKDPSLIERARALFLESTKGEKYHTMIPADKKPEIFE